MIGRTNISGVRINTHIFTVDSEPTNYKVGWIWIKTSKQPVTKIAISPTQPTGPLNLVDGKIWIQDNSSTWRNPNFNFTTSSKIDFRCFPGTVYQYDGEQWVQLDAYFAHRDGDPSVLGWHTKFSSKLVGTITVNFPAGSTVKCKDASGTRTASISSTATTCTFTIKRGCECTISATKGNQTVEKKVTISTDGQKSTVTLAFDVTLSASKALTHKFNDTSFTLPITVTDDTSNKGYWTITTKGGYDYGAHGAVYFKDVDLTNYSKITLKIKVGYSTIAGYKTAPVLVVYSSMPDEYTGSSKKAEKSIDTETSSAVTVSVDVKSLTGKHCVAIYLSNETICDIYSWVVS